MQVGKSLAHYEIIAQIGVGGMGEVWRARDTKLNREVALKFLPAAFTSDAGRHARFRTEAQALAAFGHPNVAGVYSFEDVDDTHFLVMEQAEGVDVSVRMLTGPLPQVTTL
ncbi:MAG: protein kinase, partial [Candidatus Krumholzibacteria bacterium]|nr:protein kinase [Candidatus Krumholzibacteria bacterium]